MVLGFYTLTCSLKVHDHTFGSALLIYKIYLNYYENNLKPLMIAHLIESIVENGNIADSSNHLDRQRRYLMVAPIQNSKYGMSLLSYHVRAD